MRTHNKGIGVGALQFCKPGAHGAGSSHGAGCHIYSSIGDNLSCGNAVKGWGPGFEAHQQPNYGVRENS